jgi:hypothetical protein
MLCHEAEIGVLQHVGSLEIDVARVLVEILETNRSVLYSFDISTKDEELDIASPYSQERIVVFNSLPRFVHCLV